MYPPQGITQTQTQVEEFEEENSSRQNEQPENRNQNAQPDRTNQNELATDRTKRNELAPAPESVRCKWRQNICQKCGGNHYSKAPCREVIDEVIAGDDKNGLATDELIAGDDANRVTVLTNLLEQTKLLI
jgi:hypothetical protein